jgi:hypothetical protein
VVGSPQATPASAGVRPDFVEIDPLAVDDGGTFPMPPDQAAMPQSITLAIHATAAGSNRTR